MTSIQALGDAYVLTELPRIPGLALSERVVVPHLQSSKSYDSTDIIDLGISKLIISSYVLKPTPKLIWSFPLSPNTVVDSMDVQNDLYIVGLTERKKSKLLLIKKIGNELSQTAEVSLKVPAIAVKFTGNKVYVLLSDGEVQLFTYDEELNIVNEKLSLAKLSGGQVVYHTLLTNHEFQQKHDLLFYIVKKQKKLIFRLVGLDSTRTYEIYQNSISSTGSLLYAYNSGIIYAFEPSTRTVSSSSLMKPHENMKLFTLKHIFEGDGEVALAAPAPERLLISHKLLIYLINFNFETLLSTYTHGDTQVFLAFALPVVGDSANTRNSYGLYLNAEEKTNTSKLNLIQVDVGLNLLRESLGKSVHREEITWNGFPHVAGDLVKENKANVKELEEVHKNLSSAQKNGNTDEFDAIALKFLKNTTSKNKFTSSDRVVDVQFIVLILALIFDCTDALEIRNEAFLPEETLMYLLTHPLYPHLYAKGLLVLLSQLNQPRLLKQAIAHCSAVSIDDLTGELINLTELADEMALEEQDEAQFILAFLRATIDRLVADYSVEQITKKMRELLNTEFDGNSKKLDRMLSVLININSNNSWTLVQAVIDVGGLFNWTIPTINKLSAVIDAKVEALTENSYNLTLTNQAAIGVQKKKSKPGVARVVDNIHEINNQRTQLDAILTITNNTHNKKLMDDGIELAKLVPAYSRERLII